MATFAQINADGIVVQVQCINDETLAGTVFPESEPIGQAFQAELGIDGTWLQCSEEGVYRGAYPGAGWSWNPDKRRKDGGTFEPPTPQEVAPGE